MVFFFVVVRPCFPTTPRVRVSATQADVTVKLEVGDAVDDVTLNVVNSVLEFIDSNPPKWQQWKEKAREAGIEWA